MRQRDFVNRSLIVSINVFENGIVEADIRSGKIEGEKIHQTIRFDVRYAPFVVEHMFTLCEDVTDELKDEVIRFVILEDEIRVRLFVEMKMQSTWMQDEVIKKITEGFDVILEKKGDAYVMLDYGNVEIVNDKEFSFLNWNESPQWGIAKLFKGKMTSVNRVYIFNKFIN